MTLLLAPLVAAPCVRCGTTGGYARNPFAPPLRSHGLCQRCRDLVRKGNDGLSPSEAQPCLRCGTKFGRVRPRRHKPERFDGLCWACHVARTDADPCVKCGTTGGAVHHGRQSRRPARIKGCCSVCYERPAQALTFGVVEGWEGRRTIILANRLMKWRLLVLDPYVPAWQWAPVIGARLALVQYRAARASLRELRRATI